MKRAHIIFNSNMEGIPHRFLIKQMAMNLGLKGYCHQNEKNQMEIEVEGKEHSIEEFLQFIQKGIQVQQESTGFSIEMFHDVKGYTRMITDIL